VAWGDHVETRSELEAAEAERINRVSDALDETRARGRRPSNEEIERELSIGEGCPICGSYDMPSPRCGECGWLDEEPDYVRLAAVLSADDEAWMDEHYA
jgi:hypothetical protein